MANHRKLSILLTWSLLFSTGTFFAQSIQHKTPATGINLSLWKNISTQPYDSISQTSLNIGIFSHLNKLNGLGVNIIGSTVEKNINGVQIAGISNMSAGSLKGLQIAGITNICGNNLTGISISGLIGITNGKTEGIVISGLSNIYGNNKGVVLGGLLNFGAQYASGIHFAGISNIVGENFTGLSLTGMLNVTGKTTKGMQTSGLANITGEDMVGVQIASIGNVTGGTLKGIQLGMANMVTRAKGVQIGLFNYYKKQLDGIQLGLVNANPHTRVQLMLFGGNTTKANIGVRFKNDLFYTILGGGSYYLDFSDKFSASAFYRAGLEIPLYKRMFISGDLGYQHIETFKNKNHGVPARLYALQTRINLEYRFNSSLSVFISGGYGGSRPYNHNYTYDKGAIVESGIVLF